MTGGDFGQKVLMKRRANEGREGKKNCITMKPE